MTPQLAHAHSGHYHISTIYDVLSLRNSILFAADTVSWCAKILNLLFHSKYYNSLRFPRASLFLRFSVLSLDVQRALRWFSDHWQKRQTYRSSSYSKCQACRPFSVSYVLSKLGPSPRVLSAFSRQARILPWGVNSPSSKHKAGKPQLVCVRKICEKRLLASSCPSVLPLVRMEQLGFDWIDFHVILYLNFFEYLSRKFKLH